MLDKRSRPYDRVLENQTLPGHPPGCPSSFASFRGPSDVELWAVEVEDDLLVASLALVDAELEWFERPSPDSAAGLLEAVAEVVDLREQFDPSYVVSVGAA